MSYHVSVTIGDIYDYDPDFDADLYPGPGLETYEVGEFEDEDEAAFKMERVNPVKHIFTKNYRSWRKPYMRVVVTDGCGTEVAARDVDAVSYLPIQYYGDCFDENIDYWCGRK